MRRFLGKLATTAVILLGLGQTKLPQSRAADAKAQTGTLSATNAGQVLPAAPPRSETVQSGNGQRRGAKSAAPKTVLMRSGAWFVYPKGCDTVRRGFNLVVHFHGAHTTVIPRYLRSELDAVLVVINKGIGSGAYSNAYAFRSDIDGLLQRIRRTVARECGEPVHTPTKVALSSWSAGYGATQQFLRFRPESVDAVLLSDGLHVGFADERRRKIRLDQLQEFVAFARRAARGERLMAIAHSAITPPEYAGAGETALALAEAAHVPHWPLVRSEHGMMQLTTARLGNFYSDGFAGKDKAAHASHLYSIDRTLFARLKAYWSG